MEEKKRYFAASNSYRGFCSYYPQVFSREELSKIYVIKGGPGTGKSTFMRSAAHFAEARGIDVTYICCSSDSHSLDGVIFRDRGIALLDGTAPHAYEPTLPGACEEIVDLGRFFRTEILARERRWIEKLVREKSAHYGRAYRALAAEHAFSENRREMVEPCVNAEKLRAFVLRTVKNTGGQGGKDRVFLSSSVGMDGDVHFDTYRREATSYVEIHDYFDTAHLLLRELSLAYAEKRIAQTRAPDPVEPERLCALSTSEATFEIAGEGDADAVNMKRFVDPEKIAAIRADFRAAFHAGNAAHAIALEELQKVQSLHFALEEIYGSAVDFSAESDFCTRFSERLFDGSHPVKS